MRSILNVSLPKPMADIVEGAVLSGQYATKSEFFRALIWDWNQQKLLNELELSRKEMQKGKKKLLTSLSDLR